MIKEGLVEGIKITGVKGSSQARVGRVVRGARTWV